MNEAALRARSLTLAEDVLALAPHPFEGVMLGVADRPCTRCGLADRHPIHAATPSGGPLDVERLARALGGDDWRNYWGDAERIAAEYARLTEDAGSPETEKRALWGDR